VACIGCKAKATKGTGTGLRSRTYRNVFWREAATAPNYYEVAVENREGSRISLPPRVGRDSLDELSHQDGRVGRLGLLAPMLEDFVIFRARTSDFCGTISRSNTPLSAKHARLNPLSSMLAHRFLPADDFPQEASLQKCRGRLEDLSCDEVRRISSRRNVDT
jgi:hypothetical protein